MIWILSKKVQFRCSDGLEAIFPCPGSGHAPRFTSQTPGTRPVPARPTCGARGCGTIESQAMTSACCCRQLPPRPDHFSKMSGKNFMIWILSQKVQFRCSDGLDAIFPCPGSDHAPRFTSQTPGTRPVPARPTCGASGRGTIGSQAMSSACRCRQVPPRSDHFSKMSRKKHDMDPLEKNEI